MASLTCGCGVGANSVRCRWHANQGSLVVPPAAVQFRRTSWPVIEYDPNNGRIRDVVTPEWAESLPVGAEVIAVCTDHAARLTDWGNAILAVVTESNPTPDGKAVVIVAEPVL